MNGKELLIKGLEKLNISYSDNQINQLIRYYEMLIEKNKVMNLTAITEFEQVVVKHFLDSLLLVKCVDLSKVESLIDVGTGAGFPGVPIKIMFPHINVTLADSLNKRLNFLNEVIDELGLENIFTVHGRAEDLGQDDKYREKYDICVSRAVANLSTLSEYCIPFVKVKGQFISYKSSISGEEIQQSNKAIKELGGQVFIQQDYELPCSELIRTFVVIDKVKNTAKKYPRKAGLPTKKPIV